MPGRCRLSSTRHQTPTWRDVPRSQPTQEQLLARAIDKARMPAYDYRVFRALFRRAAWGSAIIPAKFQPRSLKVIARDAQCSEATVKRALRHLERHGWVVRARDAFKGRGHSTTYGLTVGEDCDCFSGRPEPKSDSERAKRYRDRKKAAQQTVTQEQGSGSDLRDEAAQICVTKRLTSRDETAGQPPFCAKEGVEGGKGRWGMVSGRDTGPHPLPDWEPGTYGHAANPAPTTTTRRAA